MKKSIENIKGIKIINPFIAEEEKELNEKPLQDLKSYLDRLNNWRSQSFYSNFIFG